MRTETPHVPSVHCISLLVVMRFGLCMRRSTIETVDVGSPEVQSTWAGMVAHLGHTKGDSQHGSCQLTLHHSHVVATCRRLSLVGDCQGVGNHEDSALGQHHIRCPDLHSQCTFL